MTRGRLLRALGLAILLLLVAGGLFVWMSLRDGTKPEFWESAIVAFEEADRASPPAPGSILFVGSSSIRFWETLEADMAPLRVLNRGFGGAHIHHVHHFAERIIAPYAPRAIVFYAGDNDVASGKSAALVVDDFEDWQAWVRRTLPEVPIYFVTIKPSRLRWDDWPEMRAVNATIADLATRDPLLRILDVSRPMLDRAESGAPPADLFAFDGLHLSAAGYALWTEVVRPRLLADLGPEPRRSGPSGDR